MQPKPNAECLAAPDFVLENFNNPPVCIARSKIQYSFKAAQILYCRQSRTASRQRHAKHETERATVHIFVTKVRIL